VDRPGFRRHLRAIINGSERGVYGLHAIRGGRLGGVAEVRKMIDDDFNGGFDDVVGLGDYIDSLLAPLS